jgi:type IV pilus assembly protein PilA
MRPTLAIARRRGFTMVEMMMVIVVIAILALIALPSYTDKLVRDQVVEALPLADIAKPAIEAGWRAGKPFPANNFEINLPDPEKIVNNVVDRVAVHEGTIRIRFGNRAHKLLKGKILSVRAAVIEDAPVVPITWLCGQAPAPDKMVVVGKNDTDVPVAFLPLRCR